MRKTLKLLSVLSVALECIQLDAIYDGKVKFYIAAAILSATAGLACQLRGDVTIKLCAMSMLNSGLCGLGLTLALSPFAPTYPETMLGLSIIAGLGGMKTIEFVESAGRDLIASLFQVLANKVGGKKE